MFLSHRRLEKTKPLWLFVYDWIKNRLTDTQVKIFLVCFLLTKPVVSMRFYPWIFVIMLDSAMYVSKTDSLCEILIGFLFKKYIYQTLSVLDKKIKYCFYRKYRARISSLVRCSSLVRGFNMAISAERLKEQGRKLTWWEYFHS